MIALCRSPGLTCRAAGVFRISRSSVCCRSHFSRKCTACGAWSCAASTSAYRKPRLISLVTQGQRPLEGPCAVLRDTLLGSVY